MKTRIEWLNELPDGYRERALANCVEWDENKPTDECGSMADAIWDMCVWRNTPEGGNFWVEVWSHYTNGTPLPPLPEIPSIAQLKAEIAALRQRIAELEAQPKKPEQPHGTQGQPKPKFESFYVDCTKSEYPEVKAILESQGYRSFFYEWMDGENCVSTGENGTYMTYNKLHRSAGRPTLTIAQLREKYGLTP